MTARRTAIGALLLLLVCAQLTVAVRLVAGAAHASRGDAALIVRDFPAAAASYTRAVHLVPFRGDWIYALAGAVRESQGDAAAIPLYEQALEQAPNSEEAMVAAAESLIDLGRRDEALALLDRAATLTPFDWRVHYLHGVVATLEGRPADAVYALRAAAKLAPGANITVLNPLANALVSTGEFEEASQLAQHAVSMQPHNPAHPLVYGKALLGLEDAERALKAFRQSAEGYRSALARGQPVAGPLAEAEEGIALALVHAGRPAEAIEPLEEVFGLSASAALRAAQRLEPWLAQTGPAAPFRLWELAVYGSLEGGNPDVTANLVAMAENFYPELSDRLLPAKARLTATDARPEEALALLRNAPQPAKGSPEFQLALALVHAQLGHHATAALEARALADRRDVTPAVRRQVGDLLANLPDR